MIIVYSFVIVKLHSIISKLVATFRCFWSWINKCLSTAILFPPVLDLTVDYAAFAPGLSTVNQLKQEPSDQPYTIFAPKIGENGENGDG